MVSRGTLVAELDTPCLLVDLPHMEANLSRWQAEIGASGCGLRPHVKTHKSPGIGRLQLQAGARGLTAAKLSEAEAGRRADLVA